MPYKPYRRQFVIHTERIALDAGWKYHALPDGWVLSYQEDLALCEYPAGNGAGGGLLLGNAYCLDGIEEGGPGRYVVLDWPRIRTDPAAATLSLFYGRDGGASVVASNAGLAAAVLRGALPGRDPLPEPDYRHELRHRTLQNYVPAPGSRYRGIRRLLRDQELDIVTGAVDRRSRPIPPLGSYQQAMDVLGSELIRFARELRDRTAGRVYLQLTAGTDSRTIAAAFTAAAIPFETVTLRSPAKPEKDITIARAISRQLGLRHSVIDLAPPDPALGEIYLRQTSGGLNDWDLTHLLPGDSYRFLAAGDVMVGGSCFELGRQKFHEAFGDLKLETATGAALWQRLAREPGPAEFVGFLDEWLAWRRGDPYCFNLVASHYLDQRLGAWAATAMSGYDLAAGTTIHPANSRRIFAALLTPDLEAQAEGRLQRDVIRALAPELLRFPINPVPLARRIRKLTGPARRAARRILETSR